MKKKLLIILGLIVVAGIVLAAFYFFKNSGPQYDSKKVKTTELDSSQIPSGFASDFPVEAGSEIIQNYEAVGGDGRKQSTRVFSSSKSAVEVGTVYRDYFINLGWGEIGRVDGEAYQFVMPMKKGDDSLLISAITDRDSKVTVEITLTEVGEK